jgi:plasmid stabilization system protein ParE
MPYLVRLADRALRDMEAIYEFIHAEGSETAFAWFNDLAREIYSLERFPERGAVTQAVELRREYDARTLVDEKRRGFTDVASIEETA